MFYGHLVYFPSFGILYREKSGSPAPPGQKWRELTGWRQKLITPKKVIANKILVSCLLCK
jgi:hypothetical protein